MEATQETTIHANEIAVQSEQKLDLPIVRELSALELSLVGGGSVAHAFY